MEIIKILEELGIEKGKISAHLEAALLSYRNSIAKEIIIKMKEKNMNEFLIIGLLASAKSNNIKGADLVFQNGANINDIQNSKLPFFRTRRSRMFLHYAIGNQSKEMFKILTFKGAPINAEDIIYQSRKIFC